MVALYTIYQYFLEALIQSGKIGEFVMVIPSRWFADGRGKSLREFARKMRESHQLKEIVDFQDSKKVFPTDDVKGGVCFVHWVKCYNGKTIIC